VAEADVRAELLGTAQEDRLELLLIEPRLARGKIARLELVDEANQAGGVDLQPARQILLREPAEGRGTVIVQARTRASSLPSAPRSSRQRF
jgi:hypothetical protein